MLGLKSLGLLVTAISVVELVTGATALKRDQESSPRNSTDLRAARSRDAEIGVSWKLVERYLTDTSLFHIATRGEIVDDADFGGSSTFENAGRASRQGLVLA